MALRHSDQPDPTFYDTRARIFQGQGQPLAGLLALAQYSEAQARAAGEQDVEQYIENQIFAAKLAVAVDEGLRYAYRALAASILENVRRFVADVIPKYLGGRKYQHEIEALLGLAYLGLPGNKSRAVDAFDRLAALSGDNATAETKWRWRLGKATALTSLARAQRRNFASPVAARHLQRAAAELADGSAIVNQFGLDLALPVGQRLLNFRLQLETAAAVHALAEESFCEGGLDAAHHLMEQQDTILISLRTALETDPALPQSLGSELARARSQVRLYEARRCFLLGRISIRSDPSFSDAGLADKVDVTFKPARGVNSELDCRIDLELGELLFDLALAGKGDVNDLYARAVATLELATTRDAPALRAVTVKVLAEAYARRGAVLGKARKSQPAT